MPYTQPIPTTHILSFGSLGHFFTPPQLRLIQELGGLPAIMTWGVAEFNLGTATQHPIQLSLPGVVDVSPDVSYIRHAGGFGGKAQFARDTEEHWRRLVAAMVDKVIDVQEGRRVLGGQTVARVGMRTGHSEPYDFAVRRLKERDRTMTIVAASVLPASYDQRRHAVTGYRLFHDLYRDDVVAVTVLTDNDGPFARRFTLAEADKFHARAEAALISALTLMGKNRSLAEIANSLGSDSPFAGLSFASRRVEAYPESVTSRLQRFFSPQADQTHLINTKHLLDEAAYATESALSDPDMRMTSDPIDLSVPCHAVYKLPVNPQHVEAWQVLTNRICQFLSHTYPKVSPTFCAVPGTPDPRYEGKSWLQVSVFYPLPPVPAAIREFGGDAQAGQSSRDSRPAEERTSPTPGVNHHQEV